MRITVNINRIKTDVPINQQQLKENLRKELQAVSGNVDLKNQKDLQNKNTVRLAVSDQVNEKNISKTVSQSINESLFT